MGKAELLMVETKGYNMQLPVHKYLKLLKKEISAYKW